MNSLIIDQVKKRDIKYLLHFTKVNNLKSIINDGLIVRNELKKFEFNDDYRIDGTNGICLSVSFPNYMMFYSCRTRFPKNEWIVLGIKPDILWEKDCIFNHTNAASKECCVNSLDDRRTSMSFSKMFHEDGVSRSSLGIPSCFTTNPQAEVISLQNIEKKYIFGFATNNVILNNSLQKIYPNEKFKVKPEFFTYRQDYAFWKKPEVA